LGPRVRAPRICLQNCRDRIYALYGFLNTTDATSAKLKGIVPSVIRPLGYYNFTDAYVA
jgi:hypothetical protein